MLLAAPAVAQTPKALTESKDWMAFEDGAGKAQVCYIASFPTKAEGNYTQRGDVMAMVSHRPGNKETNVVSLVMGYPLKTAEDARVELNIDGKAFYLAPVGSSAWAYEDDRAAIINAMRRGRSMIVKGVSKRGTLTTDTYSLSGFTATHKAIGKACGIK